MSRRDEFVESISTLRAEVAVGVAGLQSSTVPGVRQLAGLAARALDLDATSGSSHPTQPGRLPFQGIQDPMLPTNPHLGPGDQQPPVSGPSISSSGGSAAPPAGGDELPAYTRRPGPASPPRAQRRTVVQTLHTYHSRSQKLRLEITAPGTGNGHVVLLGGGPDERVNITGVLHLTLAQPEVISHIKIRVKGLIRTLVLKSGGSSRHPIADEVGWEDALDLVSETTILPHNESIDPLKTQGTFSFPFTLHLPSKLQASLIGRTGSKTFPLPPSFILSGGDSRSLNEWASCRYYVKVTLGRKGLLKQNERLIVPLIYIPRSPEPVGSIARLQAMAQGHTIIPSALEDPRGWSGKKLTQPVKRGVFSGRKAWYTVVVLLPTPATFARLTNIPLQIKIVSSDPQNTTMFPHTSVTCFLVQRAEVMAQGITGLHDLIVAGGDVVDDGPKMGTVIPISESTLATGASPAVWGKELKASISLGPKVSTSFAAPNLAISFIVVVRVSCPGVGNNAELTFPVTIVSSFRGPTMGAPAPPQAADLSLPPSYFEVIDGNE